MEAINLLETLNKNDFGPYMGVPCSFLTELINCIITNNDKYIYYENANEGEAMGLAAGFSLCGKTPVVMMQNSGLGNAVNPLTSLNLLYKMKSLLIITLRGEEGISDEPQHKIMGEITTDMLEVLNVKYEYLSVDGFNEQISRIRNYIDDNHTSFALIVKKGSFNKGNNNINYNTFKTTRLDAIANVCKNITNDDIVVSTTGKISRELYYHGRECESNFYTVGSMGCASSIGLGVSLNYPQKNVFILDGDGAVLMKLGTLSTIGKYKPKSYIHIVLDNESYESTGGQKTNSDTTQIEKVAENCGYTRVYKLYELNDLSKIIEYEKSAKEGPVMILIKVSDNSDDKSLGRPEHSPLYYKNRFMNFINN